ncbi:MAG: hypothetical protein IID28_07755 [Planctomycetes bacterium]|nr:hypothetical protein [Planctomycetota bacterium]
MTPGSPSPRPAYVRWLGLGLGVILLAAAVAMVVTRREIFGSAVAAIRHPAAGDVALLLGTILANVVLTGLVFSVLMSRYGRVGVLEMQALIAAAALANFLPLRPGLFGRAAYHKALNDIPIAATFKVTLVAMALSVTIAAYLALALFAAGHTTIQLWVMVAVPVPVLAAAAVRRRSRGVVVAGLFRYVEVLLLAVRYHAAFALIGSPIEHASALTISCVSLVATLVPLSGNGLGLREWAVGIAAPLVTPWVVEMGLAADLLNRAAEVLLVVPLGVGALAWLGWRRRSTRVTRSPGPSS